MNKEKLALGGSMLSAIAASLCCIGPLVAVIVGASGFAAAAGLFAQWRRLFLTITALMLAAAWYLTYRHPKADHCFTERCLRNPVEKWNKVILWLATAFVIAIAAFPAYSGVAARLLVPAGAFESGPSRVKLATLQVNIPSMDCGACAAGIQAKLKERDGVQAARVDFATGTAVIRFDPRKLSPEKITALIDETGFKAEPTTFGKAMRRVDPDQISLFRVPLRCGMAPEIGCGSLARPLLVALEHTPGHYGGLAQPGWDAAGRRRE